jgi:hypothetical protein
MTGLFRTITNETVPFPEEIGEEYRALYNDQARIGWTQLFHGRFSKLWAQSVDRHLKTLEVDRRTHAGQIWVKKVIIKLWDALHETWKERNKDLHRKEGPTTLQLKRTQLLREITELYNDKPLMLSCDRDIFDTPLSERLTQHTNGLRQFLALAKPIVKRSKADATDVLLTGQGKIRSFLRRPTIPEHLIDILADLPNRDDPVLPEDEGPPDPVLEEDSVSEDWDS